MEQSLAILAATAATFGFIHTLAGPDHYLPFVLMSQSGKWTMKKTMVVTFLCGLGHVLSSVVLGFVGVMIGAKVTNLIAIESSRGNLAAWGLIIFGFAYLVYGIFTAIRKKYHRHSPISDKKITPWVLFLIFVLGPCEPLIPLLMYPAAEYGISQTIFIACLFSAITILTMMSIVFLSVYSTKFIHFHKLEKYTNAIAGATILMCGISIQFLGL